MSQSTSSAMRYASTCRQMPKRPKHSTSVQSVHASACHLEHDAGSDAVSLALGLARWGQSEGEGSSIERCADIVCPATTTHAARIDADLLLFVRA